MIRRTIVLNLYWLLPVVNQAINHFLSYRKWSLRYTILFLMYLQKYIVECLHGDNT